MNLPATATLLARQIDIIPGELEEEAFLTGFFRHRLDRNLPLEHRLSAILETGSTRRLVGLGREFDVRVADGLHTDPRKFIASKLASVCLQRFRGTNVWDALRNSASLFTTDLWRPFFQGAGAFPLWELLPSQLIAIQSGLLGEAEETFSLQMPTSAGKTALCELLIYHEVKVRNRRVLFLVPFRALAAEIREGMTRRLEDAGVWIVASHGGNLPTRSETVTVQDAEVLIVTPEKFTAIAQVLPDIETQYDTIICDEGQLIDDMHRGLHYELLLTKLRGSDTRPRKMVFISAILPNMDELHEWLGGDPKHLITSTYKAVETDYAFLIPQPNSGGSWQLSFNPIHPRPRSYFLVRFIVKDDFRFINPSTGRPKLIAGWNTNLSMACATAMKARRAGPVALFTTSRGVHGISGLAKKFVALCESDAMVARKAPTPSIHLPNLAEFIEFLLGENYLLSRLLKFGAGFHHGMLPQEVRRAMEEAIQNRVITILLCTTTLAEGVNLPIRTLVVHTVQRYNPGSQRRDFLPRRSIKNIIGRAGRAGKETRGRVIFVNDSEKQFVEQVLRDQGMESARGALYRLVVAIDNFIKRNNITLANEFIDRVADAGFQSLIDSIDFTLLDLIPADTLQSDIDRHIDELIERTLASRYCSSDDLQECLRTLLTLRAEKIKETVNANDWPKLRRSGASSRFWNFVSSSGVLDHPLWESLSDATETDWISEVILPLLNAPNIDIETEVNVIRKVVEGWMSGQTYAELAIDCGCGVDDLLLIVVDHVGYRLQDRVAKLCQLAMDSEEDTTLSEMARNWPSLLQYGLGTLQQLDLFERGATDRLAVWGLSRLLERQSIDLRGVELVRYIRDQGQHVRKELEADVRVPKLSMVRLCKELRIPV